MKRIVFAALAVLGTAAAQAQYLPGTLSVKPMAGVVNSTIAFMQDNPKSIWGFAGGVEADYQLTDRIGLSAGVVYSQQGAEARYITVSNCIPSWGIDGPKRTRTEYVNIPLLFNYYPVKGLALKIGFQSGFLTKAEERWVIYYEDHQERHFDWSDRFRKYDFAIPVGISYEYRGIAADLRYTYGLTRPLKDSYQGALRESYTTASGLRNTALILTLGYKIPIIKGKVKPKKEKSGGKQYIYSPNE